MLPASFVQGLNDESSSFSVAFNFKKWAFDSSNWFVIGRSNQILEKLWFWFSESIFIETNVFIFPVTALVDSFQFVKNRLMQKSAVLFIISDFSEAEKVKRLLQFIRFRNFKLTFVQSSHLDFYQFFKATAVK